jgi:hypothetical protein
MYSAIGTKRQQSENSNYNDIHRETTSFFWTIFSSISRWTVISSIALVLVIIMFSISIMAFTHSPNFDERDHLWTSIDKYLTSDIFDKVLPTIIIPLVAFIWRIYDNNTKQKEQELKEKRKSRQQELKENRIKTIESTFEEWYKMNKLVSEVRFLESNDIKAIEQVQLQIAEHSISFGKLIYIWSSRFPILPDTIVSLFINHTVSLYWGAWAVAYSIKNSIVEPKMTKTYNNNQWVQQETIPIRINDELQESLGIFQRGIVSTGFLNLVYVLKTSAELLEHIEEYFPYDEHIQYCTINVIKRSIENQFAKRFDPKEKDCHIYTQIRDYQMNIAHQLSLNQEETVIEPISTFLNKYQDDIDSLIKDIDEEITMNLIKLHPKMAYQIRKAKEQLNHNVGDLIKYLCRLKIYELLLGLDKFTKGELLPNDCQAFFEDIMQIRYRYSDRKKIDSVRLSYQQVKDKIEENLPLYPAEWDNEKYKKIINSIEYKTFFSLFNQIQNSDLLNMVAADTIVFIRNVGRMIRFTRILFYNEDMAPVS